jgi:hypothetical protein
MTDSVESIRPKSNDTTSTAAKLHASAYSDSETRSTKPQHVSSTSTDTTLTFTDPYKSANDQSTAAHTSVAASQQWTVAIDLTTSITDQNGTKVAGADSQWKQLQQLASETANKPITMVVSVDELPSTSSDSQPGQKSPSGDAKQGASPGQPADTVSEYIVRNGQIKLVESGQSQGVAADLKKLLTTATKLAPADHLALILQSHGTGGALGIASDDGSSASLTDLTSTIQSALKGSGHDHLDVLDFDACLMGSASTLHAVSSVADHIVASSEEENAANDGKYDAQDLSKVMSDLLRTPSMTPSQLSDDFIHDADLGYNGKPELSTDDINHLHAGTDTLAAFDMSKYPQFQGQLNSFGQALDQALKSSPQNKAAIIAAIDQTQSLPLRVPSATTDARDLLQFTESIQTAVKTGQISDPDGKLAAAAAGMLAAQKAMTSSFHHTDTSDYANMGGLSVDLPPVSGSDIHERAQDQTDVERLISATAHDSFSLQGAQDAGLQQLVASLPAELKNDHVNASESSAVDRAMAAAEKATTPEAFDEAIKSLHVAAEQLAQNPGIEAEVATYENRIREYSQPQASSDGGPSWNGFIADLYAAGS